jgi:catechol 2,3-dioxygenase-like lactoylglutathione lyase family enzyme
VRATAALALALALWWSLAGDRSSATLPAVEAVQAVAGVALTVSDVDRAAGFYTRVLRFEVLDVSEAAGPPYERLLGVPGARLRVARLRLGAETVELIEFREPRGRPVPEGSRSNDRWFQHIAIVVGDMEQAYAWLQRHRVEHVSPAPQRLPDWNPGAAGIRAFYFKDPDGHPLEIIQYPPGIGDPRWQRSSDRVFLGIDHTAIVVADTERSLGFYRDTLGLRVDGRGENWGPEQERLNAVPGARLRITTLRAPAGPGIELLEYLAPRDGRPSAGIRGNDLAHWQTLLVSGDVGATAAALAGRFAPPPPTVVELGHPARPLRAAFVARDPDGHAVQVRARRLSD